MRNASARDRPADRFDAARGLLAGNESPPVFATCATRRAVDPSDATAIGLKALLSTHRVYALPLVAGRTRRPALIARRVSSPKSAQTSCSPISGISALPAAATGGPPWFRPEAGTGACSLGASTHRGLQRDARPGRPGPRDRFHAARPGNGASATATTRNCGLHWERWLAAIFPTCAGRHDGGMGAIGAASRS